MESGNSGSMAQSSTDGDEEYDSPHFVAGAESSYPPREIPFSTATAPPPPPPPPYLVDPLAAYSTLLNPDGAWSTRSTPNPNTSINSQPTPAAGKNPRKRTRASKRAPTTVLTTDTTNFRAMVQEFTGIPASPFSTAAASSSSHLFPGVRARLDQLFGSNRTLLPELPPQQRRPPYNYHLQGNINHQIQPPTTAPTLITTNTPDVINYQLPISDLGMISNNIPNNPHQQINNGQFNWAEGCLGSTRSAINGGNCNANRLLHHHPSSPPDRLIKNNGMNLTEVIRCDGTLESWICSTDH